MLYCSTDGDNAQVREVDPATEEDVCEISVSPPGVTVGQVLHFVSTVLCQIMATVNVIASFVCRMLVYSRY